MDIIIIINPKRIFLPCQQVIKTYLPISSSSIDYFIMFVFFAISLCLGSWRRNDTPERTSAPTPAKSTTGQLNQTNKPNPTPSKPTELPIGMRSPPGFERNRDTKTQTQSVSTPRNPPATGGSKAETGKKPIQSSLPVNTSWVCMTLLPALSFPLIQSPVLPYFTSFFFLSMC